MTHPEIIYDGLIMAENSLADRKEKVRCFGSCVMCAGASPNVSSLNPTKTVLRKPLEPNSNVLFHLSICLN